MWKPKISLVKENQKITVNFWEQNKACAYFNCAEKALLKHKVIKSEFKNFLRLGFYN